MKKRKKYLIMGIHNGFSHPNKLYYLNILNYLKKSNESQNWFFMMQILS
jgi:hypothetical protein